MKAWGINTIVFPVFGNRGDRIHGIANPQSDVGVCYSTSHSPVIDDILGNVAQITHSHRIKHFAWITTRRAIYEASNNMLDKEFLVAKMFSCYLTKSSQVQN